MKISRLFNSLPKRLAAGGLIALAVALPVASSAASLVKIEADTTVANASTSAGSMNWGKTTAASYNQVVAVQVVYNNDEEAGSGKTANNLTVKINIPNKSGATQTVTTKTSSDNSNAVTGSANVTLNRADAYLQYIPGTATWKHASSANGPMTVTQKVSDDVVTNPNGLRLENENPCQAGSIVVEARVMVPGVQVTKEVRNMTTGANWATSNTAKPDETLQYRITYQNTGNTEETKVIIRDNLPKGTTLVPGSTYLINQTNSNGALSASNAISQGGIYIGDYAPSANAYVIFSVKMPSEDQLACGQNTLTNIGVAQPEGMQEYWNSAQTTINKVCQSQPVYSCDLFHLAVDQDSKTVTVDKFQKTANNGATFNNVTIDWNDTSTSLVTDNPLNKTHTYTGVGPYTVTATAHFTVDGKSVSAVGNCTQTVSFPATPPTTPPVLPNTGAGNVIGIFAGVVAASTIGYRLFLSRKLARR